jgi:hypothetical protein
VSCWSTQSVRSLSSRPECNEPFICCTLYLTRRHSQNTCPSFPPNYE